MSITEILKANSNAAKATGALSAIITTYCVVKSQPMQAIETGIEYISQGIEHITEVGRNSLNYAKLNAGNQTQSSDNETANNDVFTSEVAKGITVVCGAVSLLVVSIGLGYICYSVGRSESPKNKS
jgi:hypothetical protein